MMNKKRIVGIIALLLVFIAIGTSYAFFNYNNDSDNSIAKSNCFKLSYSDNGPLSIMSAIPLGEVEGSALDPYVFTVTNMCDIKASYDVNIEILNDSTLEESEVRYKLDDAASDILGSMPTSDTIINNDVKISKTIYSGVFEGNESKTFNLRMWLDSDTTYEKGADKEFYTKVAIVSTYARKEYTISFDGGELFSEFGNSAYGNFNALSYTYQDGVLSMTAKHDDAYFGFKINATLVKGKKYHFQMESDGVYEHDNKSDSVEAFLRSVTKMDLSYQRMEYINYNFISKLTDDVELRLDVNKSGMTHTFSNWSLKEVINSKNVKSGVMIGELPTPAERSGYEFIGWYTGDNKYVNSYTVFNYGQDITLHAKWEPAGKLTIDPDGGIYKGSSNTKTIYRAYGEYYTLETPVKEGYTFRGWHMVSGDRLNMLIGQNAPSTISDTKIFTTKNDTYLYTNIKTNKQYVNGHWDFAKWDTYTPVVGHTYEISGYLRINSVRNNYVQLRHAAFSNDYNSENKLSVIYNQSQPWTKFTLTRTFDSNPIGYGSNGQTRALEPLFEIYSPDQAGRDYMFDIDIRDVVVKDVNDDEFKLNNNFIYKFSNTDTVLKALWDEA